MLHTAYLALTAWFGVLIGAPHVLSQLSSSSKLPFEYLQVGKIRIDGVDTRRPSNLHSLQRQLGVAHIGHISAGRDGDAGFSYTCYHGGSGASRFVVVLQSDDEMGGAEERIVKFVVAERGMIPRLEKRCSALRDSTVRPITDRGLRLGMSHGEVERILGTPTRQHDASVGYVGYDHRKNPDPGSCGDDYTAFATLDFTYRDDRVVMLVAARDDQC
jgi:hypothetical protein